MKTNYTISTFLIVALTALLVVACGGGGDGNNSFVPTIGVGITPNNAEAISAEVMDSVDIVEGASAGSGVITGVLVTTGDSNFNYPDFFVRQLDRLSELETQSNEGSVTGVVIPPTTEPCLSGSMTISGTVTDEDSLSTGDSISITFNNCDEDGDVLNGTINMTISQVTGSLDGPPPFTLGIDVVLSSFSVNDGVLVITANGDISMSLSEDATGGSSMTLSGKSLTASAAGDVQTITNYSYNFMGKNNGDFSANLSGTIASTVIGGSVSFVTNVIFEGNDFILSGNPTAGVLMITTSIDNSRALFTAQSNGINVDIEVDADGDGIYEDLITTTWTALDSL